MATRNPLTRSKRKLRLMTTKLKGGLLDESKIAWEVNKIISKLENDQIEELVAEELLHKDTLADINKQKQFYKELSSKS